MSNHQYSPDYSDKELTVCSILVKKVKEYFQDEAHCKDFEKWYRNKYGKDYVWKK